MKLEVGMYVRTKEGYIAKIEYIEDETVYCDKFLWIKYGEHVDFIELNNEEDIKRIIKTSHNIIDLIEVGDYVNGNLVTSVEKEKDIWIGFGDYDLYITDTNKIKSLITKEQFEAMKYKVN